MIPPLAYESNKFSMKAPLSKLSFSTDAQAKLEGNWMNKKCAKCHP